MTQSNDTPTDCFGTEDDAKERFESYEKRDPFPLIPASLLNSADIYDYVSKTGMVFPFNGKILKSASYPISIGDEVIYWKENGKKETLHLSKGKGFEVPANSIVFIKTKEYFRFPYYIAIRFNLKIKNVHRGILLGTGPIVDPGFEGHLLVPLHNLTTNNYLFQEGEEFIWIDFNKISPNEKWTQSQVDTYFGYSLQGKYVKFDKSKTNKTPTDYLNSAHKGAIRSSIPEQTIAARRIAKKARFTSIVNIISAVVLIATLFGVLVTNFFGTEQIIVQINQKVGQNAENITELRAELWMAQSPINETQLSTIENRLREIENEIRDLNIRSPVENQ